MTDLTPRQTEVLSLVCDGRSYKAIAHEMGLSERTVEQHAAEAYRRIGVRTRFEAAAKVYRNGGTA